MHSDLWLDLQYFADAGAAGGEGGEGSATGVDSGDAGQKVLEGLGVPADRREKWAKSKVRRDIPTANVQQANGDGQQAAAGDAGQGGGRKSWDEIISDPEYKQAFDSQVQGIVRQRLAKTTQMQETFNKLQPALEFLATKYKLPTENLDYDALASAIQSDDSIVENYADERGTSLETARADLKDKLELERLRRENRISMDRQTIQTHINKLHEQAEEVRQFDPNFDVDKEIAENAVFARMTSPQIGMSVADAYFACHRKEILAQRDQAQAQQAITAVANTIRANQSRPRENGAAMPSSVTSKSYKDMSASERSAFKDELKKRWARGEKPMVGTIR